MVSVQFGGTINCQPIIPTNSYSAIRFKNWNFWSSPFRVTKVITPSLINLSKASSTLGRIAYGTERALQYLGTTEGSTSRENDFPLNKPRPGENYSENLPVKEST